jgi:hypothetical protein
MERATEALSSKLVACHCGFGGVDRRKVSCVVGEATTCASWRAARLKVKATGERRQCWVAPLHWACAACLQPPKLGA